MADRGNARQAVRNLSRRSECVKPFSDWLTIGSARSYSSSMISGPRRVGAVHPVPHDQAICSGQSH